VGNDKKPHFFLTRHGEVEGEDLLRLNEQSVKGSVLRRGIERGQEAHLGGIIQQLPRLNSTVNGLTHRTGEGGRSGGNRTAKGGHCWFSEGGSGESVATASGCALRES